MLVGGWMIGQKLGGSEKIGQAIWPEARGAGEYNLEDFSWSRGGDQDQRSRWEIHRAKSAKLVQVASRTQIVKRSV